MNHLVFEPRIWLLVFGGIAWLLKAVQGTKSARSSRPAAPSDTEADAQSRTRRVQEEVRRKIAERQAGRRPAAIPPASYTGPVASPVVAPRPVADRPSWMDRGRDSAPIQIEEPPTEVSAEETAALVRQQKLADQLNALNEADRAAQARQSAAITAGVTPAPVNTPAEGWLAELREPPGVRRAILVREILGPPVCFR